jgi:hypothetical protein
MITNSREKVVNLCPKANYRGDEGIFCPNVNIGFEFTPFRSKCWWYTVDEYERICLNKIGRLDSMEVRNGNK